MEAADAGIKVIVCITGRHSVKDMMAAKEYVDALDCRLVGRTAPAFITPAEAKVGIMPGFILQKEL